MISAAKNKHPHRFSSRLRALVTPGLLLTLPSNLVEPGRRGKNKLHHSFWNVLLQKNGRRVTQRRVNLRPHDSKSIQRGQSNLSLCRRYRCTKQAPTRTHRGRPQSLQQPSQREAQIESREMHIWRKQGKAARLPRLSKRNRGQSREN